MEQSQKTISTKKADTDNYDTIIKSVNSSIDDKWMMYIHLPHDNNWNVSSYKNIYSVNNIQDCFSLFHSIPNTFIHKSMMFFMRKHIKPVWEDEHNRNGGSFSFKITALNDMSPEEIVATTFKQLCYAIITNTLSPNKDFINAINGITISPKRHFYILKLWMANTYYSEHSLISTKYESKSGKYIHIDNNIKLPFDGCIFQKQNPEF